MTIEKRDRNKNLKAVSTPCVVAVGQVLRVEENRYFTRLSFQTLDQRRESILVARSDTNSIPLIVKQLLDAGWGGPSAKEAQYEAVTAAINNAPNDIQRVTRRTGWHGDSFVGYNFTAGTQKGILTLDAGAVSWTPLALSKGKTENWRSGLKRPCKKSHFLAFAIGIAFAGPLLHLLGDIEGCLFHLWGESSTGKTLAGRACLSTFSRALKNDVRTFATTDRALEEMLSLSSDIAFVLDELGRAKGGDKAVRDLTQMLAFTAAGGSGRSRAKVAEKLGLPNLSWRALGITTGEEPLSAFAPSGRYRGEEVRHIDIAIPKAKDGGIFADAKSESSVLAKAAERAIGDNYGRAFARYVRHVTAEPRKIKAKAERAIEAFIKHSNVGNDPWKRRFAMKFALVYAGMIIAVSAKTAPWDAKRAGVVALKMYRLATQSVFDPHEAVTVLLDDIREAIIEGKKLPQIQKGNSLSNELARVAWGFCRRHPHHGDLIALDPRWLEKRLGSPVAVAQVKEILASRNLLIKSNGPGGVQLKVKGFPTGNRSRWVCIDRAALG